MKRKIPSRRISITLSEDLHDHIVRRSKTAGLSVSRTAALMLARNSKNMVIVPPRISQLLAKAIRLQQQLLKDKAVDPNHLRDITDFLTGLRRWVEGCDV